MTRINLLPWREERRQQREREFYGMLALAAFAGVVVAFLWIFWMGARIDNQNERNNYLKAQIKQLDTKIEEIKELEETRDRLLARKEIIEQLQANRSQMVHLFDELVKATPDSVRLTSMTQNGTALSLAGVAQSNASVAAYMRNITSSPWLGEVDLKKTEKTGEESLMPYVFDLNTVLTKPEDEQASEADQGEDEPAIEASTAAAAGDQS